MPSARELAYWHPFNVDQWYPQVHELTFHSEFIHLTTEDAKELIIVLEENASSVEPTLYTEQRAEVHPVLAKVSSEIDEKLKNFDGGHAFVRLSSRSPKDAILGDVIDKHLDAEIQQFLAQGHRPIVANMHPLVYIASAKALEVRSGAEALHLLLNSFRVLEDLKYYTENPTVFPVCITLREWVDIPPSMEFRGFVSENQFTAMTQYFHESYFEDLVSQKKQVEQQILEFWEKSAKERLRYLGSYVIDFAVVQGRVWILELNPFFYVSHNVILLSYYAVTWYVLDFYTVIYRLRKDKYTGTGLFSWEGHTQRLTKGPFKFSILKSPLSHGNIWINGKIRKSLERVQPPS